MGYNKCSPIGFCIPILVVIAGVYAFEQIDETLYLFLASHFVPPPPCPENEAYKACLGDCISDCSTRGACQSFGCSHQGGCDCLQNFVRMTPGGACEPVHGCPEPVCSENETFRECGPVCESCMGVRCRLLQCEHRCYCKEGHLRDMGGKCIPEDQCPPRPHCHHDEELGTSGRKDEYCLRDKDEVSNATTETTELCYCKEGFSRNTMGQCVADRFCAMTKCRSGEVYLACPKKCNTTCRTYGDASCEEDGQCFPGCFCAEGRLANDFRRCVPLHECPPGSNPFAPTAGPTSTPAITSSGTTPSTPPTTENDASGSSLATSLDSNTTVDNYENTPNSGSTADASTTEATTPMTSQTTARDGTETSTTSSGEPKDQTDDKPKDRKMKDQANDELKKQNPKEQAAGMPKDQALDELKDRKLKDQSADSPKDQAATKAKGKSEASSKERVQEDDKGKYVSGEEKKKPTKAKKATTPIDMEEENE